MTQQTQKDERKAKLKDAELRQSLAEARSAEAEADRAELKLWQDNVGINYAKAMPEYNGYFTFTGVVNESSVDRITSKLQTYARLHPGAPIELTITSPGGSILEGLNLYAAIRQVAKTNIVTTVASGYAASMGAVLLQAGDQRVMDAQSWMLIHEASSFTVGKLTDLKNSVKFTESLTMQMLGILAERSTMTKEEIWDKIEGKDWWLTATESLDLGFVDVIRTFEGYGAGVSG